LEMEKISKMTLTVIQIPYTQSCKIGGSEE